MFVLLLELTLETEKYFKYTPPFRRQNFYFEAAENTIFYNILI